TVVVGRGELAGRAQAEVAQVSTDVHRFGAVEELAGWVPPDGTWVPLVVLVDDADDEGAQHIGVDRVVQSLARLPVLAQARLLVGPPGTSRTGMSASVDAGLVDGVVAAPWTAGNLARYAEAQVHRAERLAGRSAPWRRSDSELLRHLATDPHTAAVELLE